MAKALQGLGRQFLRHQQPQAAVPASIVASGHLQCLSNGLGGKTDSKTLSWWAFSCLFKGDLRPAGLRESCVSDRALASGEGRDLCFHKIQATAVALLLLFHLEHCDPVSRFSFLHPQPPLWDSFL